MRLFLHTRAILIIGFVLVVIGCVVPFLMVMQMIPSNFVLAFLSYALSTLGLFLGVIGLAMRQPTGKD